MSSKRSKSDSNALPTVFVIGYIAAKCEVVYTAAASGPYNAIAAYMVLIRFGTACP